MKTFLQQSSVRRWLALAGLALITRILAFLPMLPHAVEVSIVISGAVAMGAATIGLTILLGRHLRAQQRLAFWEMPGMGIMVLALGLTNPLFLPKVVAPGWMFAIGWLACTIGLVAGILGYMAYRDRERTSVSVGQYRDEER